MFLRLINPLWVISCYRLVSSLKTKSRLSANNTYIFYVFSRCMALTLISAEERSYYTRLWSCIFRRQNVWAPTRCVVKRVGKVYPFVILLWVAVGWWCWPRYLDLAWRRCGDLFISRIPFIRGTSLETVVVNTNN